MGVSLGTIFRGEKTLGKSKNKKPLEMNPAFIWLKESSINKRIFEARIDWGIRRTLSQYYFKESIYR